MDTKVTTKTNLMQVIEKTSPAQLPAIPEIADRFKKLYSIIHPGQRSEIFYEAEKFHFMKLIGENNNLQACSKLSLYGCFMDVAVNGLSFDPSFKHLYLVPFSTNIGSKQDPKWEKRAQLQISGYGELLLRQKQGQVKYADNPVLVYEGDVLEFGNENDKFFITHKAKIPRASDKIIACYLRIVRIDGSVDYKVITEDDMVRFQKFSKDPKSKAWVDGIAGMWVAKCIKHAFKNYPKVRTGQFSDLQSKVVDEEAEVVSSTTMVIPDKIDYGVNGAAEPVQNAAPASQPANDIDDDSFVGSNSTEPAVQVNDDDF